MAPRKYRMKEVVEAMQILPETLERAVAWSNGREAEEICPEDANKKYVAVNVPTMRGVIRISEGDYLVKQAGQFRKEYRRDFEDQYEQVA